MPIDYTGHADQLLSGISVQYTQEAEQFVADKVFSTFPVQHQSDEFLVYPRGWFLRNQVRERPLGGEPAEATYGLSSDFYRAKEYALAAVLDDRERANATAPFDPEESHVRFLTENHLINREILFARSYFRAGVWGVNLTGQSGAISATAQTSTTNIQQWDQATSKPQKAIDELKERQGLLVGREGNVLLLGRTAYTHIKSHPEIIDRLKYTTSEAVTKQILARYFEVDDVLVPQAVQNLAPELAPQLGDNVLNSYILNNKSMLLMYRNNNVGPRMLTGGLNFIWRGLLGGAGFTFPVYRDRKTRAFSDWFAVRTAFDMKVIAPDCGIYVDNIVA